MIVTTIARPQTLLAVEAVDGTWAVVLVVPDDEGREHLMPLCNLFDTREQAEEHIALHPELYGAPNTPAEEGE